MKSCQQGNREAILNFIEGSNKFLKRFSSTFFVASPVNRTKYTGVEYNNVRNFAAWSVHGSVHFCKFTPYLENLSQFEESF